MRHEGVLELFEREFVLEDARDPLRTLRGRITVPAGTENLSGSEERARRLPYVLVLHGFKGFMDWGFYPELARRLAQSGLAVVRFNFSGSGHGARPLEFTESQAFFENTPSREIEDVERVRAWLDAGAVPSIDVERGALLGHSLGGAVALIHAARRADYRALVGWASCATFRRFPPEVEGLWRRQGFVEIPNLRTKEVHRLGLGWLEDLERNARALDVLAVSRTLATPALFVHGSDDEAVPLREGESIFRACPSHLARMEVVPRANHTFWAVHPLESVPAALDRALHVTTDFLARRLGAATQDDAPAVC